MQNLLFDFLSKYITLTESEKDALTSLDIFRTVPKGTVLLSEGQYSDCGYFVLKGCIRTYYIIDGEENTTAFYTELEGVTPNCVATKQPSQYYIASTEGSVVSISTPGMEAEIFEKFPRFESLCRVISEEIIAKQQLNYDDFKTSTPEQRYLKLLEQRPDLIERVPQYHIASFLGIKPQSLSRLKARIMANN